MLVYRNEKGLFKWWNVLYIQVSIYFDGLSVNFRDVDVYYSERLIELLLILKEPNIQLNHKKENCGGFE